MMMMERVLLRSAIGRQGIYVPMPSSHHAQHTRIDTQRDADRKDARHARPPFSSSSKICKGFD